MYLDTLIAGKDLTESEAMQVASSLFSEENAVPSAALLVLLQAKGVTADELSGFLRVMQLQMTRLSLDRPVMDLVGTGGDKANTVNISTAASVVVASCGGRVLKHGNRSVSSQCGSADFLEACGVVLDVTPDCIQACVDRLGMGFCYAPNFHPVLGQLKALRQSLGVPTILNILGPLLNPAAPSSGIFGVYDPTLLQLYADVLVRQGIRRALVVHGSGLDELNTLGPVDAIFINAGVQTPMMIDPKQYGFQYTKLSDLQGGSPKDNQRLLTSVLQGASSPLRDTITFNAGAALFVAGHSKSVDEGIRAAETALSEGRPYETLQQLAVMTQEACYA